MIPPGAAPAGSGAATFASVLASRRMCRDYLEDPVDPGVLDGVLAAAFAGPSAGNTAAVHLVVLQGDAVSRYWSISLGERSGSFRWPGLLRAPVLVLAYVEPGAYPRRYAREDKAASGLGASTADWPVPYWWVDGGAAVMAVLLAAEAAGLGALLFGQFDHEPELRAGFGVPDALRALGTVALGHPAPDGRRPSRSAAAGRVDPATRIHRDRW